MPDEYDVEDLKKEIEKREKAMKDEDPKATLAEINKAIAEVKAMKKDSTGAEEK